MNRDLASGYWLTVRGEKQPSASDRGHGQLAPLGCGQSSVHESALSAGRPKGDTECMVIEIRTVAGNTEKCTGPLYGFLNRFSGFHPVRRAGCCRAGHEDEQGRAQADRARAGALNRELEHEAGTSQL